MLICWRRTRHEVTKCQCHLCECEGKCCAQYNKAHKAILTMKGIIYSYCLDSNDETAEATRYPFSYKIHEGLCRMND